MNFTPQQIAWAKLHDWFISGNPYFITGIERWSDGKSSLVSFTSFKKLRDWAGY